MFFMKYTPAGMQKKYKAGTVLKNKKERITLPEYKTHYRGKGLRKSLIWVMEPNKVWNLSRKKVVEQKKAEQSFETWKDYHRGKLDRIQWYCTTWPWQEPMIRAAGKIGCIPKIRQASTPRHTCKDREQTWVSSQHRSTLQKYLMTTSPGHIF